MTKKVDKYIKEQDVDRIVDARVKVRVTNILKLIRKEIYRREDKFCASINNFHDSTIRAVPLYSLEGMLHDIKRALED